LSPAEKGCAAQPLHMATVDIDEAVNANMEALTTFSTCRRHEAPPFSGGVWDSWPALVVDAFAICNEEVESIRAYLRAPAPEVSDG
jgi:hypothetical protein